MAFFYPLAWLGALALSVPLWLHLQRRDESQLVRFSAMQFLDEQPIARRRPLWPRDWPLLLLRLLMLLLLVLAFTWPYDTDVVDAPIRTSRVYILDRTLSHQAAGRFERARDYLRNEITGSSMDTQLAVVDLTGSPRVLARWGADREATVEQIAGLKVSHQRGSFLSAFQLAAKLLDQALGSDKQIVLLSDSQANQWEEGRNTPPFLKNVRVTLPEIEQKSLSNLALHDPIVHVYQMGDRSVAACSVELTRSPDASGKLDELVVHLTFVANGIEQGTQPIKVPKGERSVSLAGEVEIDRATWFRGEFRLRDNADELNADDVVYFSLPPVKPGQLVLLTDSRYLQTACSPEVMLDRWLARQPNAEAPLKLEPADELVCVDSRLLVRKAVRNLVFDAVNSGRGLMVMVTPGDALTHRLLLDLHVNVEGESPTQDVSQSFRYVNVDHPVFEDFRSGRLGRVTDIRVRHYRKLSFSDAMPIAFSKQGDPLLAEVSIGKGAALVFAMALDRTDTNWPLQPAFVPFLDRCFQYIRPRVESQETDYLAAELCQWRVPPGIDARFLTLQAPEKPAIDRLRKIRIEEGKAEFTLPDQPGHFELHYDGSTDIAAVIGVNVDKSESDLEFIDRPEVLEIWKVPDSENVNREVELQLTAAALTTSEILRQTIWWWFLVAGSTAFVLEMLWVSFRSKVQ